MFDLGAFSALAVIRGDPGGGLRLAVLTGRATANTNNPRGEEPRALGFLSCPSLGVSLGARPSLVLVVALLAVLLAALLATS